MKNIKNKSINKKNIIILGILGAIIIIMCLLNISAISVIAGFNQSICQHFADYKNAYESMDYQTILAVEEDIAYTMTHSNTRINGTFIFNIVLLILSSCMIYSTYSSLNKLIAIPVQAINSKIQYIADGDLTIQFDLEDNQNKQMVEDEIVLMQMNMNEMTTKLKNIISNVICVSKNVANSMDLLNEGADAISKSTSDISLAITEVSNGAVSTAEDTNNATQIVSNIEENILGIKDSTENLSNAASNMNIAKDNVVSILSEFVEVNNSMKDNVNDTNNQINITSKSVKEIQKFIEVIKNIASETNLLSLNAQIEASHAGVAGKGFSVVASKIGKLADQSKRSSEEIEETLNVLLENYDLIIQKMSTTNENIVSQNIKLAETRDNFSVLNNDINVTVDKIKEINIMIEELDASRKNLVDIITSLSAVSEENAASSEETTASVEELLAIISQMCEDIKDVKEETNVLLDGVNVFTIEK